MSTAEGWTLDPERVGGSLEIWIRDQSPDEDTRRKVREFLLWLEIEPLSRGKEDPDHPGIWFGRVSGTNVGVTYVPVTETHVVFVTIIR